MLPPADTFTWALPRLQSPQNSLSDTPASPRRQAWPPTYPLHTTQRSLPCLHPLSFRTCKGLHSYLRPYTSNTSSSSSSLKRSTAGSFLTHPGSDGMACKCTCGFRKLNANPFNSIAEEPRSVFLWILTGCVQVMNTPLPSMFLSQ